MLSTLSYTYCFYKDYILLVEDNFCRYSFTRWKKSTLNARSRIFQYDRKEPAYLKRLLQECVGKRSILTAKQRIIQVKGML